MFKLWQKVYQISRENLVEEMYIVWIYSLERTKCDKEYFFNAPKQLIALRKDKKYDWVICTHEYNNPSEIWYWKIYIDCQEAIDRAKDMIEYQKRKQDKEEKILSLRIQIEELENS